MGQAGDDLVIHATELVDAEIRKNLNTTQRHAEHIINLIEGRGGPNYGDADRDGILDDPGDGSGILNYLQAVESAKDVSEVKPLSNQVRERLNKLRDDALAVIEAQELSTVSVLSEAMFDLSKRVVLEGLEPIEEKLRDAGVGESAFFIPPLTAVGAEPGRVNISMERFQFKPPTITVRVGTTVVWVNNEQPRHTATSDTDIFNSGSMDRGATFEFTLNDVGVVAYFCRFHGDKGGVGMGRDNYSPAIVTLDSGTQQPTPYTLLTNRSPALEGPAAEPGLAHDKVSAHRTESRLSVLCYLA